MADLDVYFRGGATGAMTAAASAQVRAAASAQAKAAALVRRTVPQPPVKRVLQGPPNYPTANKFPQAFLPPPKPPPPPQQKKPPAIDPLNPNTQVGPLGVENLAGPRGLAYQTSRKSDDEREDRPEFKKEIGNAPIIEKAPPRNSVINVGTTGIQRDAEGTGLKTSRGANSTIAKMLDDVEHDPIRSPERIEALRLMSNAFHQNSRNKLFKPDEFMDNPLLRTMNDLSVWSRYRKMVSDWQARKKKLGEEGRTAEGGGDGTFTGLVDTGSFSSVTSPSALSPYLVTRDESGLLTVLSAEQWIQAKYTDMHKDPALAAQVITALAVSSMYGSDSTANSQASRVVVDKNGNPVKAIASGEDLAALKRFANEAAIFQNMGEEVAIDDVLAEVVKLGFEVSAMNEANGEHGGGGGGGYRRYGGGGGGYGGYGGGGGGGQSVRLTDAAAITAFGDSVGRQRLGRSLTPEEHAQLVAYIHNAERLSSAAYYAGGEFMQVDPEAKAIEWVQNNLMREAAGQQAGNLAVAFMQMMDTTRLFGGISS